MQECRMLPSSIHHAGELGEVLQAVICPKLSKRLGLWKAALGKQVRLVLTNAFAKSGQTDSDAAASFCSSASLRSPSLVWTS